MKFSQYEYIRPEFNEISNLINNLTKDFGKSQSLSHQKELWLKINDLRNEWLTAQCVVHIRHSINVNDEFYDEEQRFFDKTQPLFDENLTDFFKVLVQSKYRAELEREFGKEIFALIDLKLSTFSSGIIDDLMEENRLVSEHDRLRSSAKIEFDGKILSLQQIQSYAQSPEPKIRHIAIKKFTSFFEDNQDKFDDIFDQLVKVRHKMAIKLGFDNFIPLAYARLERLDYNAEDVKRYREDIFKHIVPFVSELRKKQAKRLGLDKLTFFDEPIEFLSGNPTPVGNEEILVKNAQKMYHELSEETGEFFDKMIEGEFMDLPSRLGKNGGGYCEYLPKLKMPYIFANFNKTTDDVNTLTHEVGHAFQIYTSRHYNFYEFNIPRMETAEIHSMSMELLTWPWMKEFYEPNQLSKLYYSNLFNSVVFIPYGALVDEFQHEVYGNPSLTPSERNNLWRRLEKKYLPDRNYSELPFLEQGGFWYRQGHIFKNPFYYIDYTLAGVCAFQFWNRSNVDRDKTWGEYLELCRLGGRYPFVKTISKINLDNPLIEGTIEKTMKPIIEYLNNYTEESLK